MIDSNDIENGFVHGTRDTFTSSHARFKPLTLLNKPKYLSVLAAYMY